MIVDKKMRACSEAAMLAHIQNADTFTLSDLHHAGDKAVCWHFGMSYRWADALLQKERKAGRIEQTGRRGAWEKVA